MKSMQGAYCCDKGEIIQTGFRLGRAITPGELFFFHKLHEALLSCVALRSMPGLMSFHVMLLCSLRHQEPCGRPSLRFTVD